MDKLWAPWRISYISHTLAKKHAKGCLFCGARRSPAAHPVFLDSAHSFGMLNIFPYNNGHVMVCPKRHIRFLEQLTDEEMLDLLKSVTRAKRLLDKTLKPQGYNIGINISDVAGAGIKNHLHIHLVPRWKGDTNFMPVLGNTKVISQSLQELLKILRAAQRKEEGR